MKSGFGIFIAVFFLFLSCTKSELKRFRKLDSSVTGVEFKNELIPSTELNILTYLYYYNGAGVAIADFNNDGLADLYFTSNQGFDKLYLNQGKLKFKDVTTEANIQDLNTWSTGVTHVDINSDGLLDIYVCKASGYRALKGKNLLYINQGSNSDGVPTFKEDAASYGLDFAGLSTQAAFFDYDLDGDLDMYLLNHSVHPNNSYGSGSLRNGYDPKSGDILFRNDDKMFVDVSYEANIFQGKIGYGLGLGISDVNTDGYPDIYVGNDFYENDYLYINQKNGTFKEIISSDSKKLGHTSHYSMGNDIADINNDGLTDILSMDMLPRNPETYKTSGLEFPYSTYENYLKNGYAPQYMQNTLHLNLGNTSFSEIAHLSGISATEWSWGGLLADFDNDGYKDIFVSNGIKGATNNMDFIQFISNDLIQKKIDKGMSEQDLELIKKIPETKVPNYFFKNLRNLQFEDTTKQWFSEEPTFSNGCAYADLDNDGDLDLVINNVNEKAFILENQDVSATKQHYLDINFEGTKQNPFGYGAKIIGYTSNKKIYQENFTTRGYLSATPPIVHLGLGEMSSLDSLKVIWPNGFCQTLSQVSVDQTLTMKVAEATNLHTYDSKAKKKNSFTKIDSVISFEHNDRTSIEFLRDPLVPWANTNEGPDISVSDLNNDGLDDFFIGGAKGQASRLYLQKDFGEFGEAQNDLFLEDAKSEDTAHVFFDMDNDDDKDLLVVSGGNEFKSGKPLHPKLYINANGSFTKDTLQFNNLEVNASKVLAEDFNNDGHIDVLITSDHVPWQFSESPKQYLFQNDGKGNFKDISKVISKDFQLIGNVKDAAWIDLDNNGFKDLILVGHWMPISIFYNDGSSFKLQKNNNLQNTHGLWNCILTTDFDKDGDIDFIAGNWGLNSKFQASLTEPITIYNYDYDMNGTNDPVVTYFKEDREIPFASKEALVKQLPSLNKKFLSYKSFANATLEDLFSKEKIDAANKKQVFELASMYFENNGQGEFLGKKLPLIAQNSNVHDIASEDFDNDGFSDILLVGNNYEISTQLGRMDASHGVLLKYAKSGDFIWDSEVEIGVSGPARRIKSIIIKNKKHYIVTINNDTPIFLLKNDE
ncbi:VCBS repeat-containing protein [Maribacter sp. 2308TA10-17]|uniref:VCBS repeat-containing protein n=1 Tax=Maribacter sp. 2308TA10-17 TaxID=3386276 RepID=UPI0039BD8C73